MNDRIADWLDGLLDEREAADVEALVERSPELLKEATRRRELLYRPSAVAPPPGDLAERIKARHRERESGRRRGGLLLRYAAAFLAGVVTTLVVVRTVPVSQAEPPLSEQLETARPTYDNIRLR